MPFAASTTKIAHTSSVEIMKGTSGVCIGQPPDLNQFSRHWLVLVTLSPQALITNLNVWRASEGTMYPSKVVPD
jgi:hypothetical protein